MPSAVHLRRPASNRRSLRPRLPGFGQASSDRRILDEGFDGHWCLGRAPPWDRAADGLQSLGQRLTVGGGEARSRRRVPATRGLWVVDKWALSVKTCQRRAEPPRLRRVEDMSGPGEPTRQGPKRNVTPSQRERLQGPKRFSPCFAARRGRVARDAAPVRARDSRAEGTQDLHRGQQGEEKKPAGTQLPAGPDRRGGRDCGCFGP